MKDLFLGDEVIDRDYIDITKVQMFFFTIALVVAYCSVLWTASWVPEGDVVHFPAFSTTMVTILGISHAGYLTVQAAPKTPTQP